MPFPSLSEDIITDGAALCEPRPAYKAPTWALVSGTATDLPRRLPASGQDQESSERVRGCAPQTSLGAPRRTRTGFGCPALDFRGWAGRTLVTRAGLALQEA